MVKNRKNANKPKRPRGRPRKYLTEDLAPKLVNFRLEPLQMKFLAHIQKYSKITKSKYLRELIKDSVEYQIFLEKHFEKLKEDK